MSTTAAPRLCPKCGMPTGAVSITTDGSRYYHPECSPHPTGSPPEGKGRVEPLLEAMRRMSADLRFHPWMREDIDAALEQYGSGPAAPSPASPADDVAGLIADMLSQADEIDHTGNKNTGPWSDDLRKWATALSRLQARLAEVTAERDNWQSRAAERDAECDKRAKAQWAAEASAATMREALTAAQKTLRSFNLREPKIDAALGGQHGK